jgi:uncharacterized protein (DUF1499 family)
MIIVWFFPAKQLGLQNGRLPPCPSSPNCVCSENTDAVHHVDPWPFMGDASAAKARLVNVLKSTPRTRIVTDDGWYLHATCTTAVWRFVDDLQFLIDPATQVIHVRSASRIGYSDLGVNRARLESLRQQFDH